MKAKKGTPIKEKKAETPTEPKGTPMKKKKAASGSAEGSPNLETMLKKARAALKGDKVEK